MKTLLSILHYAYHVELCEPQCQEFPKCMQQSPRTGKRRGTQLKGLSDLYTYQHPHPRHHAEGGPQEGRRWRLEPCNRDPGLGSGLGRVQRMLGQGEAEVQPLALRGLQEHPEQHLVVTPASLSSQQVQHRCPLPRTFPFPRAHSACDCILQRSVSASRVHTCPPHSTCCIYFRRVMSLKQALKANEDKAEKEVLKQEACSSLTFLRWYQLRPLHPPPAPVTLQPGCSPGGDPRDACEQCDGEHAPAASPRLIPGTPSSALHSIRSDSSA